MSDFTAEWRVTLADALREVAAPMRWASDHLEDDDPVVDGLISSANRLRRDG